MGISVQNYLLARQANTIMNQNVKKKNLAMAHLSAGEKLVSAGEGASDYSISEKMKVLMRALDQDNQNVQTGTTLLHVAEGGINQQVELLKTIKAKVLDASNDTNTDADRAIIQKEVDQGYAEIDDISVETNYNHQLVLNGNHIAETVKSWAILNEPIEVKGSADLGLIPDKYPVLNGKTGPFDVFTPFVKKSVDITELGLSGAGGNFSGATASTPATWTIDLNQVGLNGGTIPSALDNRGFSFCSPQYSYVLTTSPSTVNYDSAYVKAIDISGCTTMRDVASKIVQVAHWPQWPDNVSVTAVDEKLTFQTDGTGTGYRAANYPLSDLTLAGKTVPAHTETKNIVTPIYNTVATVPGTGRIGTAHLSGGLDAIGDPSNPDYHAAEYASYSANLSGAPVNSGFSVGGLNFRLVSGNSTSYNSNEAIYDIGTSYNGTVCQNGGFKVSISNGALSVQALYPGTAANAITLTDGIPGHLVHTGNNTTTEDVAVPTTVFTAVTALGVPAQTDVVDGATGDRAVYMMDLSTYNTTDSAALETFIDALAGKALHLSTNVDYEFRDSRSTQLDSRQQVAGSQGMDLNVLRGAVASGKTIAAAFASMMVGAAAPVYDVDGTTVTGIKFTSALDGIAGNSETISGVSGSLRHYDIDFSSWLAAKGNVGNMAEYLDNKGFRAYCATCTDQWFNFELFNGLDNLQDKPKSGVGEKDIKAILIDVSKVTDAKSLVETIYKQGTETLNKLNHNLHLAMDPDAGVLTIYDERAQDLAALYGKYYQAPGPKIADGILDNVVRQERNIDVERLYIQHTDKSSKNICIDIPKTSLDQIFQFIPSDHAMKQYTVMTAEARDCLLGKPPEEGILDKGIRYLTDANVLVGAQINHLASAHDNIVIQHENATAAESVIRDADMAGTMADYVKSNVLAQAAQFMLSQSNQNSSSVLTLLK